MDQLKDAIAEKEAELTAAFQRIVGLGSTMMLGELTRPAPEQITGGFVFRGVAWEPGSLPVGDLHLMRAVPIIARGGSLSGWRLRVRWALPWWDDSDTKDHRRFEVDRWVMGLDGDPNVFVGLSTEGNTAVLLQGFANPDEEEREIVANYRAWLDHRAANADRFTELDKRILEHELEVMREQDANG